MIPGHFDIEKVLLEFREYLERFYPYFDYVKYEAGFDVDSLDYFIGDEVSWDRITDYYKLKGLRNYYSEAGKFREQYIYEALELVFGEFEKYSRQDINWLKEAIFNKAMTKGYKKSWDNRLYGALVHELVKQSSSQKNSIEFVSKISGVTETVIRDSYYETKKLIKKFNLNPLGTSPYSRIEHYLVDNEGVINSIAANPKFAKSADALNRLKVQLENFGRKRAKLMEKVKKDIEHLHPSYDTTKVQKNRQNPNA